MSTFDQLMRELTETNWDAIPKTDPTWLRRDVLIRRTTMARSANDEIAEFEPKLVDLKQWRSFLVEARRILRNDPPANPLSGPRAAMDWSMGLRLSMQAIEQNLDWQNQLVPIRMPIFEMMRAAGYETWLGCLPATEERIAVVQNRVDVAKQTLEAVLRDPVTV